MLHDRPYDGPKAETIRVWGRDRLRVLARLLPLLDEAEVYLLGTGLPSFWSVRMGEMRLLLGLSGWTANDWTGGSSPGAARPAGRAQPLPGRRRSPPASGRTRRRRWRRSPRGPAGPSRRCSPCLNQLAGLGQVIHDLHAGRLPMAAGDARDPLRRAARPRGPRDRRRPRDRPRRSRSGSPGTRPGPTASASSKARSSTAPSRSSSTPTAGCSGASAPARTTTPAASARAPAATSRPSATGPRPARARRAWRPGSPRSGIEPGSARLDRPAFTSARGRPARAWGRAARPCGRPPSPRGPTRGEKWPSPDGR